MLTTLYIVPQAKAQTFLGGSYIRSEVKFDGSNFTTYHFSRKSNKKNGKVKAKYFAKDANEQFARWKNDKRILYYCSGAFSISWDSDSPPLGICVDNGVIVNRDLDATMDGLIIVYNGGAQAGGIAVINLDKEKVTTKNNGVSTTYDLRNYSDRARFLNWAVNNDATVFQTQLMYTKTYGYGFPPNKITYGNKATRRFLGICIRKGVVYHVVVDYNESDYLNQAADKVTRYLTNTMGYDVIGLFNLDTGGKDIMKAYNDSGGEIDSGDYNVNIATNLLVYYVD
ncbi:MAG: hypothetical protein AAFQ83_07835 [Bacteroidota bacterium]